MRFHLHNQAVYQLSCLKSSSCLANQVPTADRDNGDKRSAENVPHRHFLVKDDQIQSDYLQHYKSVLYHSH